MATRRAVSRRTNTSNVAVQERQPATKPNISTPVVSTTPEHLDCRKPNTSVPTGWKDMQCLAKSLGIKAGGRGVTSSVLNTWLTEHQRLGMAQFAMQYPEALSKAPTKKVDGVKVAIAVPESLAGMSFREAQAYVKELREINTPKGHKGKLQTHLKGLGIKATTWQGIIDMERALIEYFKSH